MKKFDFKKYVEFKVYSVTTIKKGYGFRVLLKFADGSDTTQQLWVPSPIEICRWFRYYPAARRVQQ